MLNILLVFRRAIIFALIYSGLFNSAVIFLDDSWKTLPFSAQVFFLGWQYFLATIPCIVLFIGLSSSKLLFKIGSCLLFLLTAGVSYYLFLFKISPDFDTVKIAFEPTEQAAYELISMPFIIWCFINVILCIVLLKLIKVPSHFSYLTRISAFAALLCFMWGMLNLTSATMVGLKKYLPVSYLDASFGYMKTHIFNSKLYVRRDELGQIDLTDDAGDTVAVLILGESARGDHFSLGGYERETNPELSKIDNLFFFPSRSCGNNTFRSVTCMLTGGDITNARNALMNVSMLARVTNSGIKTSWLGTQSMFNSYKKLTTTSLYDDIDNLVIPTHSAMYNMYAHDEVMLPYYNYLLESTQKSQLIVLHTTGSHWHYDLRYPSEYEHFKPTCQSSGRLQQELWLCPQKQLINSYDNSIRYTDHFIAEVIKTLQEKNAFVIYVSDHGEALGENGHYFHSGGKYVPQHYNVPLIFWGSQTFINSHPNLLNHLNELSSSQPEVGFEYILHSMLDCLGFSGSGVKKKYSLCAAN